MEVMADAIRRLPVPVGRRPPRPAREEPSVYLDPKQVPTKTNQNEKPGFRFRQVLAGKKRLRAGRAPNAFGFARCRGDEIEKRAVAAQCCINRQVRCATAARCASHSHGTRCIMIPAWQQGIYVYLELSPK